MLIIAYGIPSREAGYLQLLQQHSHNSGNKGRNGVLDMSNFLDTTNIDGRFDYSEWVRAYGRYLDETLDVWSKISFFAGKDNVGEMSSLRELSGEELLRQLPILQKLQQRMMDCKPGGAARDDPVVQAALFATLKESFRIYKAVSEGIINLADKFFEMEYLDAQRGLEIYKESVVDNTKLQEYYAQMQKLEPLKNMIQFPKLESLPADFLSQMEEYVKEAPRDVNTAKSAPQKKSPPLRKGSKAKAQQRAGLRSDNSSEIGVPSMPIPSLEAEEPQRTPDNELNLMDLEDVDAQSSQPQVSPEHGVASYVNQPPHSSDTNAYLEALTSQSAGLPERGQPSWQAGSPAPAASTGPNSIPPSTSGDGLFWPPTSMFAQQGEPNSPQSYQSTEPSKSPQPAFSPVVSSPRLGHAGFTGAAVTPLQPQSFSQAQTFSQPQSSPRRPAGIQFQPRGGAMALNGNFQAAAGQDYQQASNGRPAGGSFAPRGYRQELAQRDGSQRALLQDAQLAEFDGSSKSKPQNSSVAGMKQNPGAASIVAGLSRPQNAVLAKEAALHDPFLDLARLDILASPRQPTASVALRDSKPLDQQNGRPGFTNISSNAAYTTQQQLPQDQFQFQF